MKAMTRRERILTASRRERTDRLPFLHWWRHMQTGWAERECRLGLLAETTAIEQTPLLPRRSSDEADAPRSSTPAAPSTTDPPLTGRHV